MSVETHDLQQGATGNVTFWHRARFMFVADQLRVEHARSLLDYGAGAGGLAQVVRGLPDTAYFYFDESDAVMDFLRDEIGAAHDGTTLLRTGKAQVTVALDVIEHIEDDLDALRTLVDSTQPGGRIIVTVPALPSLWSSWDTKLGHFRRYTRASLRTLGVRAGLEPIEVSYLFPEMLPAGILRRIGDRRAAQRDGAAEFPRFTPVLDRLLFIVARLTTRLRHLAPAGTSVVAVFRKPLADHLASASHGSEETRGADASGS